MKARSTSNSILMVLGAAFMLLLSATLAWGVVTDYQSHGVVPQGVTVAGQDLGGMTEEQARAAMDTAVATPMLRPVTVVYGNKTWTLDPKGLVSIDVDTMIDEAYSSRRTATFVQRLDSQLRGTPLPKEVAPAFSVDTTALAAWVGETATQVDREPTDATRTIVGYKFKVKKSATGAKVDRAATTQVLATALGAERALSDAPRTVPLQVAKIKPKVNESSFKTAIIVSISERRIRLYKGAKLVKTYRCAPGRPAFPTPTGDFVIRSKQHMAPWINPGSDWAKDMPAVIPGGPSNPMGIDKIGINSSGIFFHGIPPSEYSSIGTAASHGCMRMMPSDVKDLMTRVAIGNPVYIRR